MNTRRLIWNTLVLCIVSFPFWVYAQEESDDAVIPGTIAYIGTDFNVYTIDPGNGTVNTITDNAEISRSELRYYRWPTWSLDGRLAFFSVEDSSTSAYTTGVHVSSDGKSPGKLLYSDEGSVFNYASWSPTNCGLSDNCRDLAVLMNKVTGGGLFIEVVSDEVENTPREIIGRGGPFYYSWSPDGKQMLWQRNNRSLDIYDFDTHDVSFSLSQHPGVFQAPHWSPIDNRWLIAKLNRETLFTELVIVDDTEEFQLASQLNGLVSFAWSPNSNYVAYVDRQGPLIVVDSQTGEVLARTLTSGVGAFFWSPSGNKIAYVTLATPPGSFSAKSRGLASPIQQRDDIGLAWSILDINTGESRRFGGFVPTSDMIYMFTYFDQFAQSHRVWSPDSRYIVYSEITDDEESVISLIDTESSTGVPLTIAEGILAIWSFD